MHYCPPFRLCVLTFVHLGFPACPVGRLYV